MTQIRPMLAAQKYREAGDLWGPAHEAVVAKHLAEDKYLIAQPKWDGFRMLHWNGIPMSRSGKPLANTLLQKFVRDFPQYQGIDGEVFPGHHYHANVFREGMSEIRASGGSGEIMIVVYDYIPIVDDRLGKFAYTARREHLIASFGLSVDRPVVLDDPDGNYCVHLLLCPQKEVRTLLELYETEQEYLVEGFEGAIVRRPNKPYKPNRSTALGGELVKVKRRDTVDAVVIGYEERLQNQNEAKTSELGFTVRSSHQENLVPTGMLGALRVRLVNGPLAGTIQKVGVFRGLSHTDLKTLWDVKETLEGRYCELSVDSAAGGYDAARCAVWVKWRDASEF